jgi:lysophospholipase L1-like esterase
MITQVGTYDPSKLVFAQYNGYVREYQYNGQPTKTLTYKKTATTEENIAFAHTGVAYSQNGQWLVTLVAGGGIMVYDTTDFKGKLVSWEAVAFKPGDTRGDTMAVSDDGRFVAVTLNTGSATAPKPSLRVYDKVSCSEQYPNLATAKTTHPCEYKDYWTGEYRTGNTRGIRDVLPAAEYPRRVRFVGSHTITFDTVYSRTSATAFKVARYSVTVPETTSREYVGLLAVGDSYISGEGAAGTYFYGTDTKQNKCHLSMYSHPYRIGPQLFQHSRSVACSGAKMLDVSMAAGDPDGVVKTGNGYIGKDGSTWVERQLNGQELVLRSFSPGYAQQNIFAREYKPRTVLLSVGGNDIGFKDILVTCIDVGLPDTCYQYYEDRLQVMEQIIGQYDRLVKTYKSMLSESSGRLYVVGYPQVAKIGGACRPNVQLSSDEIKFSNQLITYLNTVIKRAAAEAGAYYVDTENALNGYRLCEAPANQSGVNGIVKGNDIGLTSVPISLGGRSGFLAIGNESYHPTQLGHKLLAQAVLAKTSNLTTSMPTPRTNSKPSVDYNDALLKGAPHLPEQLRHREAIKWMNDNDTPDILLKGNPYSTNISGGTLKPNTNMQIVLRSNPITVYEGVYDSEIPARFTIPDSIPPGFHTLDIYGTDDGRSPRPGACRQQAPGESRLGRRRPSVGTGGARGRGDRPDGRHWLRRR